MSNFYCLFGMLILHSQLILIKTEDNLVNISLTLWMWLCHACSHLLQSNKMYFAQVTAWCIIDTFYCCKIGYELISKKVTTCEMCPSFSVSGTESTKTTNCSRNGSRIVCEWTKQQQWQHDEEERLIIHHDHPLACCYFCFESTLTVSTWQQWRVVFGMPGIFTRKVCTMRQKRVDDKKRNNSASLITKS